jgi:hypothetical protein
MFASCSEKKGFFACACYLLRTVRRKELRNPGRLTGTCIVLRREGKKKRVVLGYAVQKIKLLYNETVYTLLY